MVRNPSMKNFLNANKLTAFVLAAFIVVLGASYAPSIVKATPLEFLILNTQAGVSSSINLTATTSVSYMSAGTATTTYYYDTFNRGNADQYATDKVALAVQFTASSSASVLNWSYEYATGNGVTDCTVATSTCDWYQDNVNTQLATSTGAYSATLPLSFSWTFASSSMVTDGVQQGALANRALKIINLTPPARYVRVVFTMPAASTNGGVWAAFIGQKQIPQ